MLKKFYIQLFYILLLFVSLTSCDKIEHFFEKDEKTTVKQVKQPQQVKNNLEQIDRNDRRNIAEQLKNKLNDIKNLRDNISLKQKEFNDKKTFFQNKIDEIKNELINEQNSERINNRVANIQEYDAYLQELDRRLQKLGPAPDKLLSLERSFEAKIEMVSLMTEDEITEIKEQINRTIKEYAPEAAELIIDSSKISLKSKEDILEEIKAEQENESKKAIENQAKLNQEIWEEILDGVYDRVYFLTELSVNAAKKLGQSDLTRLNLSNLLKLSPKAAKQLSVWGGWVLNLDGITELTPKVAKNLSKWDSIEKIVKNGFIEKCRDDYDYCNCIQNVSLTLNLNGLTSLEEESASFLSQWKGNNINLNGLKELLPETAKKLFKWKNSIKWKDTSNYYYCMNHRYKDNYNCYCYNEKKAITINGIRYLDRESVQYMREWKGDSISLMGLMDIQPNAAVYLKTHNRSFSELHIPDKIKINYPEL
ncbi:conserved hypothetical protein [Candidatus Magnetomoraceae bacterium gMMP-15]